MKKLLLAPLKLTWLLLKSPFLLWKKLRKKFSIPSLLLAATLTLSTSIILLMINYHANQMAHIYRETVILTGATYFGSCMENMGTAELLLRDEKLKTQRAIPENLKIGICLAKSRTLLKEKFGIAVPEPEYFREE